MLSRADGAAAAHYVTIDELRLTVGHLVVIGKMEEDTMVESLVPAEKVQIGDQINGADGWKAVTSVTVPKYAVDGTFAPLTMSSKIVVNGTLCSCYTESSISRSIPLSSPVRLLYKASATAVQWLSDMAWDLKTSRPKVWMADQPMWHGVPIPV